MAPVKPSDIKIMIVEDDDALRESLLLFFKSLKFTVTSAKSGNDAVSVLNENKSTQIILSDIRMADGNGIELLKEVRKAHPRDLKFFFMTGYADLNLEGAFGLGADGFFEKPFSIATVRDCIQQTFLDKNALWSRRPATSDFTIKKSYGGFLEMTIAEDMRFGRAGVFFAMKDVFPKIGDMCSFQIELKDRKPCKQVSGLGPVRWVRKEAVGELPAGIGIEICYLAQECRDPLITWIDAKNNLSTIPLK